jgi:hypothetical protein
MTTVWRIKPEAAIASRVQDLAAKEMRPVANMLRVLVGEALFARQMAESKRNLVDAIRGEPRIRGDQT